MRLLFGLGPDQPAVDTLGVVLDRVSATGDDLTVAVFGDAPERADLAASARDRLDRASVQADVRELEDDPGARLVELAAAEEFDRIVLPGGRRSPLGKITFDDVTEFVLLNATTSVTLIR